MPTPRTMTITVTTKDDEASVQELDVVVRFNPALPPQAKSYLNCLAATIVRALADVGTLKEKSRG